MAMMAGDELLSQAPARLCALIARENNEPRIGTATQFDDLIAIEVAPPWPRDVWRAEHVPAGLLDIFERAGQKKRKLRAQALLPDERSSPEQSRVFFFKRPPGPFAVYEKAEFVLPTDQVTPLVEALLERPEALPRYTPYRQESDHLRELLLCTHGNRDSCCGTFGYTFYTTLRQHPAVQAGQVRVWRTSHIGGHRFAPTLLDLPYGHGWGHLETELLPILLEQNGPLTALLPHYRGWCACGQFEQIVEQAIWQREGWAWLDYHKASQRLDIDSTNGSAKVRFDFYLPNGNISGRYEAVVDPAGSVLTMKSSGEPLTEVEQYRLSYLAKV